MNRADWRHLAVLLVRGPGMILVVLGGIGAAQLLGTDGYGTFATVNAFVSIASATMAAGHIERAVRVGALSSDGASREARARAIARSLLRFAPAMGLLVLPIGLLANSPVWVVLAIGLPSAILLAGVHVLEGYARGAHQALRDVVPFQLAYPAMFALGCGLALALDVEVGAVALLGLRLAMLIAVVLYFTWRLHLIARVDEPRPTLEPVGGFAAAKMMFVIQGQSAILLAGLVAADTAGIYTAVFRSTEPITAAMGALALMGGPIAARAAQGSGIDSEQLRLRRLTRIGLALGVIPAIIVIVFPDLVLNLFGEDFRGASTALRVLAIARLSTAAFGSSVIFANAAGLKRPIGMWMSIAVALQLGLALPLVALGELTITRLALIDALGTLTWNIGLWTSCHRQLGVTTAAWGVSR